MPRTGDETDDYCTRCHRLTNHTIAAMVADSIASTACRTCGFQHEYKGGQAPARSSRPKTSAFDQVLAGILGEQGPPAEASPRPAGRNRTRSKKPGAKRPPSPK